jgi:hypothetical protein
MNGAPLEASFQQAADAPLPEMARRAPKWHTIQTNS